MIAFIIFCIYVFIGIIFAAVSDALEYGYTTIIKVILFWPFVVLLGIAFFLYWLVFHRD